MPWDIAQRDGRYCVVKQGESKPVPGGCHDTRREAEAHRRALYASESDGGGSGMSETTRPWEGPLGLEGHTTADKRYLLRGEITSRDLPLPLRYQPADVGAHVAAVSAGSIETIEWIPLTEFDRAEEFGLTNVSQDAVVIWGTGHIDEGQAGDEALRHIENGAGVSLDIGHDRLALLDPDTLEEIPQDEVRLEAALAGDYVMGIAGTIEAATIVDIAAFKEARVQIAEGHALVASALPIKLGALPFAALVAAAGVGKPSRSWFENPQLRQLTPMTYLPSGQVFGHLCDWSGCHTGFSHICVPPFRSTTEFAYFNVGQIETDDGSLMPCGKLMFSMDDIGHFDAKNPDWRKAAEHYDKAAHVGAFVRAGSDQFGIWLAGCVRPGLSEEELQHLRTHPPSGDWRPIPGKGSELIAAFAVAVPGFPIPQALVASAGESDLTIITAPLVVEPLGPRALKRRRLALQARRRELLALGAAEEDLEPVA